MKCLLVFILGALILMSCTSKKENNYVKNQLLGEGDYKAYDDSGRIIMEGFYSNHKFTGKRIIYEDSDSIKIYFYNNDNFNSYLEKVDSSFYEWLVLNREEELFIDINQKILLQGDSLKLKFIVNHHITDSLKLWIDNRPLNDNANFIYPNERTIKFIYSKKVKDMGLHGIRVKVYLKRFNGKTDSLTYDIAYYGFNWPF